MVHRCVQGLKQPICVLFLLQLDVSRQVGDVDDLALFLLEHEVHTLHDYCFLGLCVTLVWILDHFVDFHWLIVYKFVYFLQENLLQ